MNTYGIDFGNPQDFANFAKYAGLGSKNANPGMPNFMGTGASSTMAGAVAPTMSQIGDRASAVGQQLQQGNFMGAAKTFQGGVAPIPALASATPALGGKPAPVDKDGDGMISEWEERDL